VKGDVDGIGHICVVGYVFELRSIVAMSLQITFSAVFIIGSISQLKIYMIFSQNSASFIFETNHILHSILRCKMKSFMIPLLYFLLAISLTMQGFYLVVDLIVASFMDLDKCHHSLMDLIVEFFMDLDKYHHSLMDLVV